MVGVPLMPSAALQPPFIQGRRPLEHHNQLRKKYGFILQKEQDSQTIINKKYNFYCRYSSFELFWYLFVETFCTVSPVPGRL